MADTAKLLISDPIYLEQLADKASEDKSIAYLIDTLSYSTIQSLLFTLPDTFHIDARSAKKPVFTKVLAFVARLIQEHFVLFTTDLSDSLILDVIKQQLFILTAIQSLRNALPSQHFEISEPKTAFNIAEISVDKTRMNPFNFYQKLSFNVNIYFEEKSGAIHVIDHNELSLKLINTYAEQRLLMHGSDSSSLDAYNPNILAELAIRRSNQLAGVGFILTAGPNTLATFARATLQELFQRAAIEINKRIIKA